MRVNLPKMRLDNYKEKPAQDSIKAPFRLEMRTGMGKGPITEAEFMQKLSAERASNQALSRND